MKYHMRMYLLLSLISISVLQLYCKSRTALPETALVADINLKKGAIISCGPADKQFGVVDFDMSCDADAKKDFNTAMSLLHSFEYDESEKVFAKVIDQSPACAMAYWGVAMSNFHPLWTPPTQAELAKGAKAVAIARSIETKTPREADYIAAIDEFYNDWSTTDHMTRTNRFKAGMERVYQKYPGDREAAILYALSLDAAASPSDKTYSNQKKAAAILNTIYPGEPNHPGVVHYIIHTYDTPELASLGLAAARRYATVAPSSAHALHMPSHIFTRLGLWDECIQSNLQSVAAAKCYAEASGIKGHWDEEMHGLDYLVYAYLQKGANDSARSLLNYIHTINKVEPTNFKVAYAFAAIPSRIALENKNWQEASALSLYPSDLEWKDYPWQESILHFAKALGYIHLNKIGMATAELNRLKELEQVLIQQKDAYKSRQVRIQVTTVQAWLDYKAGKNDVALKGMELAADMEDSTGKHAVTPGEVLPARELLADLLLAMKLPAEALIQYQNVLKKTPNRFNSLHGARLAAGQSGNDQRAAEYYQQLAAVTKGVKSDHMEIVARVNYSNDRHAAIATITHPEKGK